MQKILLLTGASGEIGKAISKIFTEHHYQLLVPSRQEMDLADIHHIEHNLNKIFNHHDAVDVFVHCAGINDPKPVKNIGFEDINKTLNINALSFYGITRYLIQHHKLKKNGYLLGISSIYGTLARPGRFSYVSSKYCLNGMIKSLAVELVELNIKANTVSPGFVDTRLTRKNNSPEVIENFIKKIPLRRLAQPEDIAKVVYFMCSENNQYINGQDIIVDGGYSIGGFES